MQLMECKFSKLHKPKQHARGSHFPTSRFPFKHSPKISTRVAAAVIRDLLIWKLCQCFLHTSCKFSLVLLDLFTVKELQCVNRNPKPPFFWWFFSCLWGSKHTGVFWCKYMTSKADVLHLPLTFNLLSQTAKSTTKCCLCEENQPAIAARSCANLPLLASSDNQVFVSHVDEPEGDPGLSNEHVHDTCTAPAAKETFTP